MKSNEQLLAESSIGGLKLTPVEETIIGYNPSAQQGVNPNQQSWLSWAAEYPISVADAYAQGFKSTVATSVRGAYAFAQKQAPTDNYNPFRDHNLLAQGDEFINQYADWFSNSPDVYSTLEGIKKIKEMQGNSELIKQHGFAHLVGMLSGGILDPLTFLPFIGAGSKVYQVSRTIGIAKSAAEGGILGAAFTAAQQQFDPTVSDDDIKSAAIFGAGLGTVLGGVYAMSIHGDSFNRWFALPEDMWGKDITPTFADDVMIWGDEVPDTIVDKPNVPITQIQTDAISRPLKVSNKNARVSPKLMKELASIKPKTTETTKQLDQPAVIEEVPVRDAQTLADEIVKLNHEFIKEDLKYQRLKETTGKTRGDENPYGKSAGQLKHKLTKLRKEYEQLTGVSFDGKPNFDNE